MLWARHLRSSHEDWDDGDIAAQSRSQFDPDKIVGVVEAAAARVVLRYQPFLADDRQ
jgi:hypothetical protein